MITQTTKLKPDEELLYTVISEQGYEDILIDNYFLLLERLKDDSYITHDTIITEYNGVFSYEVTLRGALGQDIWCGFVELYGEYGVTLRSGWITDKKGFINFIEHCIIWGEYGIQHNFKERNPNSRCETFCDKPLKYYLENDLKSCTDKYGINNLSLSDMICIMYDDDYYLNNHDFRDRYVVGNDSHIYYLDSFQEKIIRIDNMISECYKKGIEKNSSGKTSREYNRAVNELYELIGDTFGVPIGSDELDVSSFEKGYVKPSLYDIQKDLWYDSYTSFTWLMNTDSSVLDLELLVGYYHACLTLHYFEVRENIPLEMRVCPPYMD